MSVTLSSLPGKFKCSLFFFCLDIITPNSGLTRPNNTISIYLYIYILSSTDRLFRSIRTHQCGETCQIPEARIETWMTVTPIQDSITRLRRNQPKRRKFKRLCIIYVLLRYIRLTATESSIHLKSLALRWWQPLLPSLERSTPQG